MSKKNNIKILSVIIGIVVIGWIVASANKQSSDKVTYYDSESNNAESSGNVSTEDQKQIIEITAKGGYSPTATIAKAGVPTILRMKTNGTYDCSSTLRIKSLNYNTNLPATGTTDIEVPAQEPGTTIAGLCSMGMYHFSITFKG